MADPTTEAVQPSYLEMSDEEIMNSSFPAEVPAAPAEEVVDEAEDEPAETPAAEAEAPEATDADDEDAGTAAEEEADEADENKETPEAEAEAPESDTKKKTEEKADESEKKPDEAAVDFEAEYKRLLTPFKANGREIAVKSVDDAIALMQMGANYNKKMAALKPNLKLMKMLENNGLLSEDKIGFLIDLEKKNPAAINKLVKDSGIDPMDLDAEKVSRLLTLLMTARLSWIRCWMKSREHLRTTGRSKLLALSGMRQVNR